MIIHLREEEADEVSEVLGEDYWDVVESAEKLFTTSGIRLARGEDIHSGFLLGGKLVGATAVLVDPRGWEGGDDRHAMQFSVAVRETARRKGVARKLIAALLEEFPADQFAIRAWVVNPHMVDLLSDFGFELEFGSEWSQDNPFMVLP